MKFLDLEIKNVYLNDKLTYDIKNQMILELLKNKNINVEDTSYLIEIFNGINSLDLIPSNKYSILVSHLDDEFELDIQNLYSNEYAWSNIEDFI